LFPRPNPVGFLDSCPDVFPCSEVFPCSVECRYLDGYPYSVSLRCLAQMAAMETPQGETQPVARRWVLTGAVWGD
jgi:hypothetical protein